MIEAFVLVVVKPGTEEKVYEALKNNERIKEIYRVYGEYDLILRVEVGSIEELDKFHDEVLRRIKNIEMTETLIASSYRG
ncbi:putative transcription regulator, Lrp/AsnC family [Thermococcus cleftensis]|uniref:Transcription regulator, Lrp/AsnC family n=1 Tax=Thermococcus cleftensis (strain DSM 27260 / KACC 17922 / CL1) TaxID=163003 RepID=I3ZSV0_THECF|nr:MULTISPECIES: Lrp/AsnC ligand binding domain-containing protein [Thermococcus]AFL94784.1 putative transcription regulator, Lrp/AsnC family [Thermococcus cleftensis]NJE03583.1 Lrp/AsnC family transcriptional regulator [Thermococcus sp. MV11]